MKTDDRIACLLERFDQKLEEEEADRIKREIRASIEAAESIDDELYRLESAVQNISIHAGALARARWAKAPMS